MREYAEKARKQRLEGNHHNNGSLAGYCLDNSYVLYHMLKQEKYSPCIVCGVSENYASDIISKKGLDNINTVEDLVGQVHYWVECNNKIIDIASDIPAKYDEIIIQDSLPNPYHRLKNSYQYAKEILNTMPRRCTYCGGRYNYCNCEK